MKKSVVGLAVFVTIALFLISCGKVAGGERPLDTAAAARIVQTGTQGVEISLIPNYPPPTMYDRNELVAMVDVKNRGNFNLEPQDCFVQILGFDPNIILGAFNLPRSCAER